jgi:hypothetical protein
MLKLDFEQLIRGYQAMTAPQVGAEAPAVQQQRCAATLCTA